MAMTREETLMQRYLSQSLREHGYKTYAELFELFEFWLTSSPHVLGYMVPGKARIVLNRTLEEDAQLLIIRHEIMHEYLTHQLRLIEWLDKEHPELHGDKDALEALFLKYRKGQYTLGNIAGDLEISNLAYTEEDKELLRHIKFNGRIVSGLVTEDYHPGWENMSVEEMYAELVKEWEQQKKEMEKQQTPDDNAQPQDGSDGEGEGGMSGTGGGESSDKGEKSDSAGGSGGKSPSTRIIRGTLDNNRFYDRTGKDVTPAIKRIGGN